ncbi:MAG: hydantoin utilization protein A [Rhodospirillaceae bacterium]|nr:hydantoin utilization protein A [Rhodospirillaceae bacterium]|tara:strand:- start:3660 stop:4313 length:654 start_codon:yes stop_codon:yes gene_type:complete
MKKYLIAAGALLSLTTPALAHHPLGGLPMDTFAHGLLSGIGHPMLGFDHLFFIALIGIAALYTGYRWIAPGAYIAAMLFGTLAMSLGLALPAAEIVIGLSLLVLGGVVLSGRALSIGPAVVLFTLFGLFHGSAFGGLIAAQEAGVGGGVLVGYLVGLGASQYLIALAAGWILGTGLKAVDASAVQVRLAGAVVAGVGVFLSLENAEALIFAAMGWAV